MGKNKKKKNNYNSSSYQNYQTGFVSKKQCPTHDGTKVIWVITNPDGSKIELAGAQGSHVAVDSNLKLVIDLAGLFKKGGKDPVQFTKGMGASEKFSTKMSSLNNYIHYPSVLRIDNPDMGIPPVGFQFWARLADLLPVGRTVCCCVGGHGRTGTALAALMLATDPQITAKESINNVRKLHCENAIESDVQEKYLAQLEIQRNKMLKEKSK